MVNSKKYRREQILEAAEKIMSLKELGETSISEIAKAAGITDSIIYRYFKGKEDILFSITSVRMKAFLDYLNEHLQGINDPLSRLRKMIWFHLFYNDTHHEYARLLLLECQSNRNFYQHEAYQSMRQYAGIMLSILENGAQDKVFRSDVNMRLIRNMILGTLDWESLSCLAAHEIANTASDLDDIMTFILPIITNSNRPSETELDKPSRIFKAAEKVFAEKGYNQATIMEIAKLANVSEGTIYEYFKNKEDLLFSISEQRFKEYSNEIPEMFEIRNPLKKLRRLIHDYFHLYLTERDFIKIFLLHLQFSRQFYSSSLYDFFRENTGLLELILLEGIKDGSFRPNINVRIFRNLFLGTFTHTALRSFVLGQDEKLDNMINIDEVVLLLLRAVANNQDAEVKKDSKKVDGRKISTEQTQ